MSLKKIDRTYLTEFNKENSLIKTIQEYVEYLESNYCDTEKSGDKVN